MWARSASRNGYAYVEGNPTNWTDPSGLCASGVPVTLETAREFGLTKLSPPTYRGLPPQSHVCADPNELQAAVERRRATATRTPPRLQPTFGQSVLAFAGTCLRVVGDVITLVPLPHAQAPAWILRAIRAGKAVQTATNLLESRSAAILRMEEAAGSSTEPVEIEVSKSDHPEAADHIEAAQKSGKPDVLTIDRPGTAARRRGALKDHDPAPKGYDLDEYPPAMFKEGGPGASVRAIPRGDNRGAGAVIGNKLRSHPDGTKVKIKVVE